MAQVVTPGNLGQEFELGTTVANKITVKVDGTSVVRAVDGTINAAPPVWDNVAKTITFPSQNGAAAQVIDLSQFTTDIYVDGFTWDAANFVLTLTDNDGGTPDIVVDLSTLVGPSSQANNALIIGADGKPYLDITTAFNVSGDANQILSNGTDNKPLLTCDTIKNTCTAICTDAFGVDVFRGFAL